MRRGGAIHPHPVAMASQHEDRHDRYAHSPDALNAPGKGMELRLIQTLVAHHRGAIELTTRPEGGTCLTLRFPLFHSLTGGPR